MTSRVRLEALRATSLATFGAALFLARVAVAQLPPPPPPSSPNTPLPPPPPPSHGTTQPEPRDREPPSRREPRDARDTTPSRTSRPVAPVYVPVERDRDEGVPTAHTMDLVFALRTGYSAALGSVSENAKMNDTFSGQIPLLAEAGIRVTPNIVLGAIVGFGFGGAAGAFKNGCSALRASCSASSFQIGLEGQYHFQPSDRLDPWLSYGLAYESNGVGGTVGGKYTGVSFGGFQFARLTAGVDYRFNRLFAIGPLLDFSFGQYSSEHDTAAGLATDRDVKPTAIHTWLTLGLRFTFLP
jgi:hypothetical protein